jgi:2-C-methyl-D-erythritol 2,4-cyclodiphosphate synthase
MNYRIGNGFDVHAFTEGRRLILGGIEIPYKKGLAGHSDADVLLHAVCDALLGSLALGDIGKHFPDTDEKYKNIDSSILLKDVHELIKAKGYKLANLDSVVALQKPKLAAFIPQIQKKIASILEAEINQVSIKATTTERLGFTGREEGVAAYAIVLVVKAD